MTRTSLLAPLALVSALSMLGASVPAAAVPGGPVRTLLRGRWVCELPGDATMQPIARPDDSFTSIPDSSYRTTAGDRGIYVLLGRILTMTSGPFDGRRFELTNRAMLRQIDGQKNYTGMRCVHAGSATGTNADDTAATDSGGDADF